LHADVRHLRGRAVTVRGPGGERDGDGAGEREHDTDDEHQTSP
jgi:hypothetical protein